MVRPASLQIVETGKIINAKVPGVISPFNTGRNFRQRKQRQLIVKSYKLSFIKYDK
jgi:hypothetical protein